MTAVDLSADCGESFGRFEIGRDVDLIPMLTSTHVACGFHASDPRVMDETVSKCKASDVAVGAHPGFADLVGFGRRPMDVTPREIETDVVYQIGALDGFCRRHGVRMQHVKPHGALYNVAAVNDDIAGGIAQGIASYDTTLIVVCQPRSAMERAATAVGLRTAREGFVDRAYNPDGTLASRRLPNTVYDDTETAVEQAMRMVLDRKVVAIDGTAIDIEVDTLCIHGDTSRALDFLRALRTELVRTGVQLRTIGEIVGARS